MRRSAATAKVNVLPAAAITKGLAGEELTEFGLLKEAGTVCLTDGRKSIQSSGLLRAAFSYAANFDLPVMHHVVDYSLAGDGVMNESAFATILGLRGMPREAETIPLARDLQLAALTGVRYHAAQISTAGVGRDRRRGEAPLADRSRAASRSTISRSTRTTSAATAPTSSSRRRSAARTTGRR